MNGEEKNKREETKGHKETLTKGRKGEESRYERRRRENKGEEGK